METIVEQGCPICGMINKGTLLAIKCQGCRCVWVPILKIPAEIIKQSMILLEKFKI